MASRRARGNDYAVGRTSGTLAPLMRNVLVSILALASGTSATGTTPSRNAQSAPAGLTIEGQLGTLLPEEVRRVLEPAAAHYTSCYDARLATHPYVAGRVELRVRVGVDGRVRWTAARVNTLGDDAVVACLDARMRALRFPPPRGGEAEFTLPMDFAGGEALRPADAWDTARVAPVVALHAAGLHRCTGARGPFAVTLYVAPHGTVAALGVASTGPDDAVAIACVTRDVMAWHVPDPGSWYAKTAFIAR